MQWKSILPFYEIEFRLWRSMGLSRPGCWRSMGLSQPGCWRSMGLSQPGCWRSAELQIKQNDLNRAEAELQTKWFGQSHKPDDLGKATNQMLWAEIHPRLFEQSYKPDDLSRAASQMIWAELQSWLSLVSPNNSTFFELAGDRNFRVTNQMIWAELQTKCFEQSYKPNQSIWAELQAKWFEQSYKPNQSIRAELQSWLSLVSPNNSTFFELAGDRNFLQNLKYSLKITQVWFQ